MVLVKYGVFLRGMFLLFLLSFFLTGCIGGNQKTSLVSENVDAPQDSLKAFFSLTIFSEDGNSQNLDAVFFSVPQKRYRMELTGSLGIGVASMLWLEKGWQMVFPTEKMYMQGAGYMVGLLNDPSLPLVHIHQIAGFFEGKMLPEKFEESSVQDSIDVDSAIVKIHNARDAAGRYFAYAEKNDEVQWIEIYGRDGKKEKLIIEEYKTFNEVKTPSKISFVRDEKVFLEIQVKKIRRGKPFGTGTWRLNIPKSYKRIDG